jgi:hypothetical protein
LYGCGTSPLISEEEHILRISETGAEESMWIKGEEVRGSWRKLHNEELHNLYSSPNIIRVIKSRRMRCMGQVICWRKIKNFIQKT